MKNKMIMALQMFAEEEPERGKEGSEGGNPKGQEGAKGKEEPEGRDIEAPKNVPKYTDEDFDRMFNQKFAKLMEKHQKELDEAKRLTEMNAQERAEHENKKLQAQVQELLRDKAVGAMTKSARAMLNEKGINIGDDLLSVLVAEDAEKTKQSVENFISLFQESVSRAVKDALKGEPPKKGTASGLTKEQILSVKDRTERQRLIQENMQLFR